MFTYNNKRKLNSQSLSRHREHERSKLMRFLRNRYTYKIIDEEQRKKFRTSLNFTYLEKIVSEHGRAAVYDHETYGIAIYKAVMAGNLNIYGLPNTYFLYSANGKQLKQVQADDERLIILEDQFNGKPFSRHADHYGLSLGKIRETIYTNVHSMRTPFIVTAEKEEVLTVRMALEAVNEAPEVIVDKNFNFNDGTGGIRVLDLKTPDHLKSLEDEYNVTIGKFMEEVGFATNTVDKKERLVASEAEDDSEILKAFDSEPYRNRLLFVELMEERFGIKLELVKTNEDLYTKVTAQTKETNNV